MNRENTRLLNAVLTTIVACLVVFAIAISVFDNNGSQVIAPSRTPSVLSTPEPVTIPVVIENTGITESGIIIDTIDESGALVATGTTNCTLDYLPVCGENAKTYSNLCMAEAANITVAYDGECKKVIFPTTSTGVESSGSVAVVPPKNDDKNCTMEYAPVCGSDNKTYSNACIAGDISIAHIGECDGTEKKTYDTGSYILYDNKNFGYSLALPKYAYYKGYGKSVDLGADHTLAISLTSSGVEDLNTAEVRVILLKTNPGLIIDGKIIDLKNGTRIFVVADETNPKIAKIVQTIMESIK